MNFLVNSFLVESRTCQHLLANFSNKKKLYYRAIFILFLSCSVLSRINLLHVPCDYIYIHAADLKKELLHLEKRITENIFN